MRHVQLLLNLRTVGLVASALINAEFLSAQLIQQEIDEAFLASRTIDVQLPVGVVAGTPGVGTTGGASWSMSFMAPPGTNGVQPAVGIAYNSQGGDGPLGWGWNMTGLSAITRTGTDWYRDVELLSTPYFNGVVGAKFTPADRFAMDGQRLVMLSGSAYGAAGSTYDTEDASFSVVTAVGSGPGHFTVVTKSGMYMEYGATADSRVLGNNASGVLSWRLNRVRDPNGNYIDYVYENADGENLLHRIDYTGNAVAGITPYNRIEFNYAPRADKNELFIHGLNGPKTSNLLSHVTVTCEGAHTKTYRFNYSERDITKSYLREITEWGVDEADHLNSTVFKYHGSVTPAMSQESFSNFIGQAHDYYSGDYDGDGDSELLASPYSYTEDGFRYNTALKVYRRDGPSTLTETWSMGLESNIQLVNGQNTPQTYTANVSNDMNGDGRDDILLCKVEWDGTYYRFRNLSILESTTNDASGFVSNPPQGYEPPAGGYNIVYPHTFNYQVSGDFNGDGKGDIVLFLANTSNGYGAFMYSPSAGIAAWPISFFATDPPGPSNFAPNICMNERLMPIDFDGDGQHEIMTVPGPNSVDQVTRIYKFWNNPFYGPDSPYPAFWKVYASSGFPTQDHELLPGDFNGDGKTDLLNRHGQYGEWHVSYSNGSDFGYGPEFDQFNTYVELPENPGGAQIDILNVADFNGDGRSDICHGHAEGGNTQLDIFYSRGSLVDFEERTHTYSGLFGMAPRMITDMNGDGRSELVNTANIYQSLDVCYFGKNGHERSLHKVVNGMNATAAFTYGFATQNGETLGNSLFAYPKGMVKLPIEVVHRSYVPDGLGSSTYTEYGYSGATVNRTGGGFLGFQRRDAIHPITNVGTISLSVPHPVYAKLLPSREERWNVAGQQMVSHSDQLYDCAPLAPVGSRRHFTKLTASTTYDDLAGTWTAVANTLWDDANGNLKLTTTNTFNIESITTSIPVYLAIGPSAVPAKPEDVTVTRTRTGEPDAVKTTNYRYIAATGNVWMVREFAGLPGNVLTTYDYNSTGTVRNKAVSALSVPTGEWPSEKFRYDPYHRFVTEGTRNWWTGSSYTDVTTVTVTDPKWGKPTSILSPDGLTTLMHYDDFGRLERTDIPHIAGTTRCSVLHHLNWALNGGEYFVAHTEDPGGADTWAYHDLLGRPVRTETEASGGAIIHSSKAYDQRGNVAEETTPHKNGEDFLTISHAYDLLNRPWQVSNPLSGATTRAWSYANNELTTTVTAPTGTTTTTTDATGRTVRGTDAGGELRNAYDSWGNLLSVRHGSDLVAENTYDDYGRQLTLWAPGAGTTNYVYNAFGKLTRQTDANGNQVDLRYDNLGRLTHRAGPEGTTQHVYYNLNGDINDNLMFVTGPGGTRSFTYDQYFRLATATSVIAGQNYVMQYEYDDCDRLTEQTYPSGLVVNTAYDDAGALEERTWAGGTLFRAQEWNGLGQLTEHEMADGRMVRQSYTHGFLERIEASGAQDLNMAYDYGTGNMSYRWDATQLLKETFDYDGLNRLEASSLHTTDFGGTPLGSPISQYDYGYDGAVGAHTRGGLTLRSDIGQLPHESRVSAAKHINYPTPYNQPPFVISQATQKITYTPFLKTATVNEQVAGDVYHLVYEYGPEQQRVRSLLTKNNIANTERIYLGEYEKQVQNGTTEEVHYISGSGGLAAIIVKTGSNWRAYAAYTDHLGSIVAVADASDGSIVARQNFDPWGRRRNPATWTYDNVPALPSWLYRGFTGHEHVEPFTLINMNGRMYDPNTGRMMAADNYVNGASATQSFNRYTYAANNPLLFSDPSGDIIWTPILIGAAIGAYSGGVMSNGGDFNPTQWNFGSGRTWKYMLGGALVGGLSGAAGYAAATSGLPGANSAAVAVGSFTNSFGMHLLTGGQSPVSISVGAVSYDFNSGKVGYLGDPENSALETAAYGLGALANAGDVLAGLHPSSVELNTEHSDAIGHSALTEVGQTRDVSLVSVGPAAGFSKNPAVFLPGDNAWPNHVGDPSVWKAIVTGVNHERIAAYGAARGKVYNLYMSSCVNHTARALTISGVPAIGIHPFLLHMQMAARSIFLRPSLLSYHALQW